MDNDRIDVVDGPLFEYGNSTEVIIEDPEDVEPLSIIVWSVGGILLVTLFALLARIILSKRKLTFESLEESPRQSPRRDNVFRIFIGGQEYTGYSNPVVHGCSDMVPEYQETQPSPRQINGNQQTSYTQSPRAGQQIYHVRMENRNTYPGSYHSSVSSPHSATQITGSVEHDRTGTSEQALNQSYRSLAENSPRTSTRVASAPVSNGRIASVNGYLISPPPYQQVVSSDSRLPSVILARQHRHQTRRLDLSL